MISSTLLLKLTLAPSLVTLASLMGRRFGHKMTGWVAGFPIVAGPILFFFAREQGLVFAASAAASSLQGLVSLAAFSVAYTRVATRMGWLASMLAGWLAFAFFTVLQQPLHLPWMLGLPLAFASFWAARKAMPHVNEPARIPTMPAWDIPFRIVATAALVLSLTGLASRLGPSWSGLLTPFPVASTVLAVFAHLHGGLGAAEKVLKSLLTSMQGFALFLAVLAATLPSLGLPVSFALALAVSCLAQALALRTVLR